MTIRGAKSAVVRMTQLRLVRPGSSHNTVLRILVGAGIVGLLAFVIDRLGHTSRLAPARERLRRVYLASSGRLDNAWSQLREVVADDTVAAA